MIRSATSFAANEGRTTVISAAARRGRWAVLAVAFALTAAMAGATSASATTSGTTGGSVSCPGTLERPFLRWADVANYVLVTGGDFEGTSSWAGSRGVKAVSGNEPWKVRSANDTKSLSIPAGGSVTTGSVCAGLGEPTLRFFGAGGGLLKVEVLYRTLLGETSHTVALVGSTGWSPTLPLPFLANVLGLTSVEGLTTTVRFRFTALGSAWQLDDVYVDPWKVD